MEEGLIMHVPADAGHREASRFIQHRAPSFHQAFLVPAHYSEQRAQFTPRTSSDSLTRDREGSAIIKKSKYQSAIIDHGRSFAEALEIYQKNHEDQSVAAFDIREKCTWDEVFREARFAESQYKSAGKVRQVFRSVGDHASLIEPWIELIPDGDYGSSLRGGLKLIFKIAGKRSDKRAKILNALEELPEILSCTQDYHALYSDDEALNDLAIELYLILLSIVEGIIRWLTDKAIWKRVQDSVVRNSDSPALDRDIRALTAQRQRFQERIDLLNKTEARETRAGISQMHGDMSFQFKALQRHGVEAQNHLFHILNEVVRANQWNCNRAMMSENRASRLERELEAERHKRLYLEAAQARSNPNAVVSRSDLLNLLRMDPERTVWDVQTVREQGHTFDPSTYSKAFWLFQHPRFQRLLQSSEPDILFVDGRLEASSFTRISPISHMCALLAETLARQSQAITLQFYCGLHMSFEDECQGIDGLLRNLIAQLVGRYEFSLVALNKRSYLNHLKDQDIGYLFDLFRTLIRKVPLHTFIFVIIDGISAFETKRWAAEAVELVKALRDMTRDEDVDAVLKVLVTSPTASRLAKQTVDAGDYLFLPPDVGEGRGALSERETAVMTRRPKRIEDVDEVAGAGLEGEEQGMDVGEAFLKLARPAT